MPLARRAEPFSGPEWLFEIKHDGFRALAYVNEGTVSLVSQRGNVYKSFSRLCEAIGKELKVREAVLDGEVVCLDSKGRSQFKSLFYRRGDPCFYAFDLLWLDGRDLCPRHLIKRKAALRGIVPPQPARVLYCDYSEEQGEKLFRLVCERDLEGILAKCVGPVLPVAGAYRRCSKTPNHSVEYLPARAPCSFVELLRGAFSP